MLDLTRVLSGPYCTMLLADMGARVIKVEQPGKGDDTRAWGPPFLEGESAYFLSINRNKESVTLDFKQPDGRAVLDALIAKSDVLVENFRPGTLKKVGLDYQSIASAYPRLVYCSVSGFGQTGPRSKQPGYDAVMQAEGGLMSITGAADGPPFRLGVAIADVVSGMFAAYGVAMALLAREYGQRAGGRRGDARRGHGAAHVSGGQLLRERQGPGAPRQPSSEHRAATETFAASDGEFVLAVGNDEQWRRFCAVAELPEEERFATNRQRVTGYDAFRPLVADRLKTQPRQHWIDRLTAAGVPCGSVRNFAELFADPQIAARNMITELEHATIGPLKMLGVPVKLSGTPGSIRTPPPMLGQHTDAILGGELGYSADAIAGLRRQNVI